ncbi:hypothetical protein AWC15_12045 [Mycobacterium lacus]|uniref:PPE domain-containing protein n=3 Tax=Mycobacterium lacus TaxID=169765 RepID=A0A1X1YUX5_9MYCO|nr:hypothetical protein AWC15_12045 [Mycobacterium lacus]BBX95091.1 hypothetical protein MLAC_03850 [Mycobacterium lacus]
MARSGVDGDGECGRAVRGVVDRCGRSRGRNGLPGQAAGSLYEAARAAATHPALVTGNRAQLVSLVASNLFGQNAPAIAATEAEYERMWAQDVAAMLNYHVGASSTVARLTSWPRMVQALPGMVGQLVGHAASAVGPSATGVRGINSGLGNDGDCNLGSGNTGSLNFGSGSVGSGNVGSGNTGNTNLGNGNTGNTNLGHGNTGNANLGSGNWS